MVVLVDHSLMFKEAKEIYERFQTAYNLVRKSEVSGEPINDTTKNFLKMWCYDAFMIPHEIREQLPILDNRRAVSF